MKKVLIIVGFIAFVALLIFADIYTNVHKWNNGVCAECGTEWHLFDIEYVKNGSDFYYYQCENGHTIKIIDDIK